MMYNFKKYLILITILCVNCLSAFADCDAFSEYEIGAHEQVYSKSVYKINAINPTNMTNWMASMYPGLRGANQLVIYTRDYGIATGTNEFGGEAIVEGNTVTSLSGADSLIPTDGLVISAHGRAKNWLNSNISVGTKIYVDKDNMTITAINTSESYIFAAKEKIEEAKSIMNYYKKNSCGYDGTKAKDYLTKAKNYLKKSERNHDEVKELATLALQNANCALAASVPYKADELKGIWIRPITADKSSIIKSLDALQNAGINNIFLETFFHERTIYPSQVMKKYGFIVQNERFLGMDPLQFWIQEAHKRNIKVNIWFETYYLGNFPMLKNSILSVKPEWSNINLRNFDSKTPVPSVSEHNGYFLDPANPEIQDFILEVLAEIITNYSPDGINIDYIRYPQSVSNSFSAYAQSNWGYTKYAREEFKLIYGEDPVNIKQGTFLWSEWEKYRRDKITLLVSKISKLARKNGIPLTAVVFPNRKLANETKQQDWLTWSENNYVDGFTPLFLTCDAKTIKSMIFDMLKDMSPKTKLYAGLFVTFMGGSEEDLVRQIHETRKLNLDGIILFDYAHFQDKYVRTLKTSIFSESVN